MTGWISYAIIVPLLPIGIAFLISILQGEAIQFQNILGGTELYMLSVVVLAVTRNDIERSSSRTFRVGMYRRVATLLISALFFCSILYGIIFMNLRAENPDIPKSSIAVLGSIMGTMTVLVCGVIQFRLRIRADKEQLP